VIAGLVLVTTNPAQLLVAGLLFSSPVYATLHENESTEPGVAGDEDGIILLVTVTVEIGVGIPEQALPV
jgi:hypothetical protein